MIKLHLNISNPWAKENFKTLFWNGGYITKNKGWEFEITRGSFEIIEFDFTYSTRQDHAGARLILGLFGYSIITQMYDNRNWDYNSI